MDLRDELHQALDEADFPSGALLAQTMSRLDEPRQSTSNRWLASLVAGVIAVALIATLVLVRANQQAPTSSHPPPRVTSTISGFVTYDFVSTQVGWVAVYTPSGQTVVAATSDGGKTWRNQLELSGLGPTATIEFIDAHDGFLIGNPDGRVPTLWTTADGGAHWQARILPPDAGLLMSSYFLDRQHGWALTTGRYSGSVPSTSGVVSQTTDGGQTWYRLGSINARQALLEQMRFTSPTNGVITTFPNSGSISLLVTQDGGRTWSRRDLPLPSMPPGSQMNVQPPAFDADSGFLVLGLLHRVGPCPSPSPGSQSTAQPCIYEPVAQYLYESTDGGITWSGPTQLQVTGNVQFISSTTWVVLSQGGLSRTTDAGNTWSTPRPLPVPSGWYASEPQFLDAQRGYVSLTDSNGKWFAFMNGQGIEGTAPKFGLLVTEDGGATWQQVGLPSM